MENQKEGKATSSTDEPQAREVEEAARNVDRVNKELVEALSSLDQLVEQTLVTTTTRLNDAWDSFDQYRRYGQTSFVLNKVTEDLQRIKRALDILAKFGYRRH